MNRLRFVLVLHLGLGTAAISTCASALAAPDAPEPSDSPPSLSSQPGAGQVGLEARGAYSAKRNTVRPAAGAVPGRSAAVRSDLLDARARATRSSNARALVRADWPSDAARPLGTVFSRLHDGDTLRSNGADFFGTLTIGSRVRSVPTAADSAALAAVSDPVTSAIDPGALAPQVSLRDIALAFVSTAVSFSLSIYHQLAIAVYLGATRPTVNQTVAFNGYNLVPSSTEVVRSFYGPWTYGPGGPTFIQGEQQYSVVNPGTQATLGTFEALVSTGTPLNMGGRYVEIVVTANEGVNVGTGAGEVPPVGSVIASAKVIGRFGWIYSAMPAQSGYVISFELTTPFGNIRIPNNFNAAEGIADHTIDNRPTDLGNGFSIVVAEPNDESYTGTSGILPLFQTVQSLQTYDIRDNATDQLMGSFRGVATTTWDALGIRTQAILVTDSFGDNVGTAAGQVPPVGSVYNVAYTGHEGQYVLYSSLRSPSGDIVSVIEGDNGKVRNIKTFPANRLDASTPPPVRRLPVSGGYSFLPISELVPSGVNGLPPRDVQIQGYQQFGYYDASGVQVGTFNAMVSNQWDWLGIQSQAILVTAVTRGSEGTKPGDVPPVGSMFNFVYLGNSGFGTGYFSLPSPSGTRIRYKLLTPILNIPTWSRYNASAGLSDVTLFDPFV